MDEQKLIKGFNSGYLLAEHTPAIIISLSATVEPPNDYLNGIRLGAEQYKKDKSIAPAKDLDTSKGKGHDIEMDKDDH